MLANVTKTSKYQCIGNPHGNSVENHILRFPQHTYRVITFEPTLYQRGREICYHLIFSNGEVLGIDHDTVCAGVGGTAIRHSTSCAGRRAAACGRAGRHNECCAWWQYHPRQRRPYKWSISILPRSQFYKKQGKLAFSTSCTAVRPHRRLRNDAWRRDS